MRDDDGLPPGYLELVTGADRPPSVLVALLPRAVPPPTSEVVLERLAEAGYLVLEHGPAGPAADTEGDADDAAAAWSLWLRVPDSGAGEMAVEVALLPTDDHTRWGLERHAFTPLEQAQAEGSVWSVAVTVELGEPVPECFHTQLRLLHAVAPDVVLVYDACSLLPRPGAWLATSARDPVPPRAGVLFEVDVVAGAPPDEDLHWVHTHGLLRSGVPELELLAVPGTDLDELVRVLTGFASLAVDIGLPEAAATHDWGLGPFTWLPWEAARAMPGLRGPGLDDVDRGDLHALPGAVLLVVDDAGEPTVTGFGAWADQIRHAVPLPVSRRDTGRRRRLAADRLARFVDLNRAHAGQPGWRFLVQLGLAVEDRDELLWFEVHRLDGEHIDATLESEPDTLLGMRRGARGLHSLEFLVDWLATGPDGAVGPDDVPAVGPRPR